MLIVDPSNSRRKVTYIGWSHDSPDLLHRVQVRAQTTVHGEDLLIDDSGDGQAVEAVGECLPQLDVVSALALVVETVDTIDGSTLVVAAEDKEVLGVLDLVCEEQANGLERLLATVDVVTKEEVVRLRREATVLEQSQQVVVLTVDISANLLHPTLVPSKGPLSSTDLDRCLELEEDRLRDEDLSRLGAQIADLSLEQLNLLAGPAAPDLKETVYDRVEIYLVFRHSCDLLLAWCRI